MERYLLLIIMKVAEHQSLTREQKEAVGLLSIGTFLEYFDLMLYVHMAVLLNELFFPKTDPFTASLLAAFAFCSTYLLRPFAALVFGYIGDHIGRKATVVITTGIMSISCLVMANLPTYAQIGIGASWAITICRIIQGMSSMGEMIGAELYISELVPLPMRYSTVSIIAVCSSLGMSAALAIANLVNTNGFNWRTAFYCGAVIALIGFFARTKLRETQDFINAKKRLSIVSDGKVPAFLEKVNKKTAIAYFLIECSWPVWFYLAYIHCSSILKEKFGYSAELIIKHNLGLSLFDLVNAAVLAYLVSKVHPLIILRIKSYIFFVFILLTPVLFNNISTPEHLFYIQLCVLLLGPTGYPAVAVFFMHFPIFKRFTYASFTYALSRALMYFISSFGIVVLVKYYSHNGLLVVMIPIIIGYIWGINHFILLEKATGNYHPLLKSRT
jgi:MFS transporter, MHS family, proline/betaine transporter